MPRIGVFCMTNTYVLPTYTAASTPATKRNVRNEYGRPRALGRTETAHTAHAEAYARCLAVCTSTVHGNSGVVNHNKAVESIGTGDPKVDNSTSLTLIELNTTCDSYRNYYYIATIAIVSRYLPAAKAVHKRRNDRAARGCGRRSSCSLGLGRFFRGPFVEVRVVVIHVYHATSPALAPTVLSGRGVGTVLWATRSVSSGESPVVSAHSGAKHAGRRYSTACNYPPILRTLTCLRDGFEAITS